jgi:two-component system phosphate regulon response regulator PhoB
MVGTRPTIRPAAARRVLVVDDDAVIRALIAVTLSVEGFELFGVADGRQAVELVASIQPHLVILDATMPKISGREVAAMLRADSRAVHIKVLLLAAPDPGHDPQATPLAGVDARLAKPFEPHELVAVVRSLMP